MRLSTLAAVIFFPLVSWAQAETGKTLEVGLTGKYPPFNYYDSSGKLVGFDVDVARELCRRTNRKCVFRTLQWDGILASLLAGKIDVIIGSMAITPEREEQASFTRPYYESGAQLFVRDIEKDPSEPGYLIGVTLGTTYEQFVRKKFPKAEVRTYKGDTEVFQDLQAGRLDGMVTDRLVGAYINRERGAGLRLWGEPLFIERIGIPLRKERKELLRDLNQALAEFRSSQGYTDLVASYFGDETARKIREESRSGFSWLNSLSLLLKGLWATAKVTAAGLLLGILAASVFSWLLVGTPGVVRNLVQILVDFVRSTPFMIQLFAVYFGLPAIGIKLQAWDAAVFSIALHVSSYLSEIFKSAYLSIPTGQHQAAAVIGLTRKEAMIHVVFPQMLPLMTAPVLNTLVAMIKDSAIISVISVYELTLQTQQLISATFRPLEFYAAAAVLYAILTYPLLILGRWQEQRFRKKGLFHAE